MEEIMKFSMALVFVATLVLSKSAFAQFDACPGGVQVGQNCSAGVCQPICKFDPSSAETSSPNRGSNPPSILVERWHVVDDRFTSFALDGESRGPFGFVFGHESQQAADAAAIQQCEGRGGTNCKVVAQGMNSCSSFAWGAGRFSVQGGGTLVEADRNSVDACTETAGVRCEVIQSGCSEPVRRIVYEEPEDFVEDTSRSQ